MVTLTGEEIEVTIAPEVGGRIVRFVDRTSGYDFLWRNSKIPLRRETPGAPYDPNFFGGIDELLPNDIPEKIAGVDCPDHGEFWTAEFEFEVVSPSKVKTHARLPLVGFDIERDLEISGSELVVISTVTNRSNRVQPFLWKLHASVAIEPGDEILCPASKFQVADPEWSRRVGTGPWLGETVPEFDGTTEFLYLLDLHAGEMAWKGKGKQFGVKFDPAVFPYCWYFASYGGFDGHHVAILEPCTSLPISVNEAHALGQCSVLHPGESLTSEYRFWGDVR